MGAGELAADALVRQGRHLLAGAPARSLPGPTLLRRAGTPDPVADRASSSCHPPPPHSRQHSSWAGPARATSAESKMKQE